MNYEQFKQLAENKTVEEIIKIINSNLENLNLKNTYYNTYTIFTEDNVAIAKGGSVDNAQAPMRLTINSYALSVEAKEAENAAQQTKENVADFIGKSIWGKEIINAEVEGDEIKITIAGDKTYGFKNINKLNSLVK